MEKPRVPLTPAQRKARQRAKDANKAKEQNRFYNRIYRSKLKIRLTEDEKRARRNRQRKYQAEYRARLKNATTSDCSFTINTAQTKKDIIPSIKRNPLHIPPNNFNFMGDSMMISEESITKIRNFYLDDDISITSPDTEDYIIVEERGKETKVAIKFLQYPVKEIYGMFRTRYPDIKVGLSVFWELIPPNVKYFLNKSLNVCACAIHENMRFILMSLKQYHTVFQHLDVDLNMHLNFVCACPSHDCFSSLCDKCTNFPKFLNLLQLIDDGNQRITWSKWVNIDGTAVDIKENSYANLVKISKTEKLVVLFEEIYDLIVDYLAHEEIRINQTNAFDALVLQTAVNDSKKAVLILSFAENFKIVHQNQSQFGKKFVTIFNIALYHCGFQGKVIVTDNNQRTKDVILAYVDRILEDLPVTVTEIEIFTNNESSQFKNEYILESLKTFEIRHLKKIRWNYFAHHHGKSIVDGIGGNVKRYVRNRIIASNLSVRNAMDFAKIAANMNRTKVILMQDSDIDHHNELIKLRLILKNARSFPRILNHHCFEVVNIGREPNTIRKLVGHKMTKTNIYN